MQDVTSGIKIVMSQLNTPMPRHRWDVTKPLYFAISTEYSQDSLSHYMIGSLVIWASTQSFKTSKNTSDSIWSEVKLRSILDNARQVRKVNLNKYMWNFVSNNPTQSQFRYQGQVPMNTSKSEFISKDLVRRGFRSVSPTVIYSFMQAAGLPNDHLIGCFRYQDCCVDAEPTTKAKKIERE
ncbi:hypothetical protein Bca101_025588 [Brassica carinata]